ncbi:methylated-DNA--[protein]-cysteine S-methyltransferase [uncultured Pseudoflavonifractor sp.]|uniref:methylated-DNA--[protein]-cysteine S-methyltransferase n=1 Tax=uncultured Pseudoflavonifractor sp. TaxID=1221379 RepID=UPI003415A50E
MDLILFDTALGPMGLEEENSAIVRLLLPGRPAPRIACRETPLLTEGKRQVLEYLAGQRREFHLPLAPGGTEFYRSVWRALEAIPYGETRSYRDIAQAVGRPRAVRAVGQANHHNPIPIIIPCHRVVGANGSLTGYAGGLELKERLLRLEAGAVEGKEN